MVTMKKSTGLWLLFYLILIVLLVVFFLQVIMPVYKSPNSRLWSTNMGYPALMREMDQAVPVEVAVVTQRDMLRIVTGVGQIGYLNRVPVNVEESGLVTDLQAQLGDAVIQGQSLLKLNTGGYEARITQLEMEQRRLKLNQARKDYEREREAYDKGLISLSDLEQYKQAYGEAQIALKKALENYENVTESRSKTVLKSQSETSVLPSEGDVIDIVSPISGTLISQNVFHGENLIGPKNRVMMIGDQLVFQASFDQRYFSDITVGTEAKLYLGAHQGEEFSAQVMRIDNHIISEAQAPRVGLPPFTFTAWLAVESTPELLAGIAEGMSGYSVIEYPYSSLALPERALVRFSGRKGLVMLVNEDNQVEVTPVEFSTSSDGWVAITSGLEQGDTVVISGQTGLLSGDKVSVK